MIDTVKIFTFISQESFEVIKRECDVKSMYSCSTGEIYYEIVSCSLSGSFDSRLSVRVSESSKYTRKGFLLEVEGSYHKIIRGHNAYDGFSNIVSITQGFIKLIENAYKIKLPSYKHWFLQRIDVTRVFDLKTNDNVKKYINYFRTLSYPRRNLKFYENESVYSNGQTTTLKIYNKLKEFEKNDMKKVWKKGFNVVKFCQKIDGYVRFECEIKKKKLLSVYKKKQFIRVSNLDYKELENIWCEEFMKMLKFDLSEVKKVKEKDDVLNRLKFYYKERLACVLYNFYLSIKVDGYDNVKEYTNEATFYRKISQLKKAGIDFSGTYQIFDENSIIDFDPFCCDCEVI